MYEHNLTVFGLPVCSFLCKVHQWTNSLVSLVCDLVTFWYQRGPPHRIKHKNNLMQRGPQRMLSPVTVACAGKKKEKKKKTEGKKFTG